MNRTNVLAVALGALGLAQMLGDVTGLDALRGLAAATTASPAPKVFSAVRGLETYSSRFHIDWRDAAGVDHSIVITPERYASLRGPYNRRNAYGAVLAYGPILATDPNTQALFTSVARHALCGDAPLLAEIGIDVATLDGPVRVRIEPIATTLPEPLPLEFVAPCRDAAPPAPGASSAEEGEPGREPTP